MGLVAILAEAKLRSRAAGGAEGQIEGHEQEAWVKGMTEGRADGLGRQGHMPWVNPQ